MRRTTTAVTATTALAAALTFGAAYASQGPSGDDTATTVVNKNGHQVDEHAAAGQARAAIARAQHEATTTPDADESTDPGDDATATDDDATEAPETTTDETDGTESTDGTETEAPEPAESPESTGPNAHAGTHPDTHALPTGTDHGQDGLPHGHAGEHGQAAEHAPAPHESGANEHAGDHPDEHAAQGGATGAAHAGR